MSANYKPILCLDFDGVIHSYTAAHRYDATTVPDPPTPGTADALEAYLAAGFDIQILSSRSHQAGGMDAMKAWMLQNFPSELCCQIGWPLVKPPALITLDDRALTFTGSWPSVAQLKTFRPWNRQ